MNWEGNSRGVTDTYKAIKIFDRIAEFYKFTRKGCIDYNFSGDEVRMYICFA